MKKLAEDDLLRYQKCGRFDEHLVTFYSLAYGEPYIYRDTYLIYYDPLSKMLSITLFELNDNEDKMECIKTSLDTFKPILFVTTSPQKLEPTIDNYRCKSTFFDRDYQIYLPEFDENLRGGSYKSLRYRVNNAMKRGYTFAIGKEITQAHSHLITLHMTKRNYNSWDYQLFLRVKDYVREFPSPILFNVFSDDMLIGFDVVDFLGETMATPLGFYLDDYPSLTDFIIYKEIVYAKEKGFRWLDIGWACSPGLEEFKRKWMAIPRFNVWVQEYAKQP